MKDNPNILIEITLKDKKTGKKRQTWRSLNNIMLESYMILFVTIVIAILQATSLYYFISVRNLNNLDAFEIVILLWLTLSSFIFVLAFKDRYHKDLKDFKREIHRDLENLKAQFKDQVDIKVQEINLKLNELEDDETISID